MKDMVVFIGSTVEDKRVGSLKRQQMRGWRGYSIPIVICNLEFQTASLHVACKGLVAYVNAANVILIGSQTLASRLPDGK